MGSPVRDYLRELERSMRARGPFEAKTLAEIDSHLQDSVEANLRLGLGQAEAEVEALRRFGSAGLIASAFERERRRRPGQRLLLALAVVAGLSIAYVDSRPGWDDTGISAGLVLLTTGLLALLGHRRPWLQAMAVGAYSGRLCRAAIVRVARLT